ncbi:DNA (cytosine-5)-methyltransferase 1 [Parasphingorhabdus marina DSM 22363]|uniref:Cytosine-specific methyltransferase n=1 Tax=Parasphingorhabdus marina DSM 22363 TaxID=1123272 RepID=A0A1N6CN90_9SPHN|nr:DNA (cytosine-5-)-methyltransferase [Parasphingorhabdus marina]SIN59905.1 DNA (cytosine-5)-methyltransferase 1 [Parasphingorhabdus marina DSM 22363]
MRPSLTFSELRQSAGLTVEDAAQELGYSPSTVYRWERGELEPKVAVYRALEMIAKISAGKPSLNDDKIAFRFIDLFAGIGGLRIGFQNIGGHCSFTSEWDRFSQETYRNNFRDNHPVHGDIREFSEDPEKIPEHDVLLAGFPCQPFSIAGVSKKNALGRPHGFLCDTQGTLFFDTAKIIAHHRPAAFVLENVKNLERHDGGRTFKTIINVLENELGYHVQHRVISAAAWVPQKRERVFIVGFKDQTTFDLASLELPPIASGPKLSSILDRNEDVDPKYTLTPKLWQYLQDYKAKHAAKGNGFGFGLCGPDDIARTLSARYYKDGSEILVAQPGNRPRRLTPKECARLMGFERSDREWHIPVSDTQAYRQFGNAVVVPVVEFLANAMKPHISQAVMRSQPRHQNQTSATGKEKEIVELALG